MVLHVGAISMAVIYSHYCNTMSLSFNMSSRRKSFMQHAVCKRNDFLNNFSSDSMMSLASSTKEDLVNLAVATRDLRHLTTDDLKTIAVETGSDVAFQNRLATFFSWIEFEWTKYSR